MIERSSNGFIFKCLSIETNYTYKRSIWKILLLELELSTNAYRRACSEGEVEMYRAHVAVLGDSEAMNKYIIKAFLDEPRYRFEQYDERKGVKTYQFKSKFNKNTQKTERWEKSVSNSSDLVTDFRNAVLSHIRSVQQDDSAKGEMETLQQSHISSTISIAKKSFVTRFESNKTEKQYMRQNIAYNLETTKRELVTQFPKPDNGTLFFLHRNAKIKEMPDKNIPYSTNLWVFDSHDKFSAMNHSFLKIEALILYVMDLRLDLFSSMEQICDEGKINKKSKNTSKNVE